jgi:hypothetical protein
VNHENIHILVCASDRFPIGMFSRGAKPPVVKPALPALPSARANASMAYDAATHSIVLFGGNINNGDTAYGDTWIFTWWAGWLQLSPATSPSPCSGAAFAYDPIARTAVLFGGASGSNIYLGDTWTWDGTTWTQQFPPVSPPARARVWNRTDSIRRGNSDDCALRWSQAEWKFLRRYLGLGWNREDLDVEVSRHQPLPKRDNTDLRPPRR